MTIRSDWRALTIPALMLLAAIWVAPPATAKAGSRPDVRSAAALVVDEASSEVLYARRATQPVPVASITKLMSALVVLESGQSRSEKLAITRDDIKRTRGSQSRLPVGARLSRGDLLHLSLMSSENRAAQALGRSYPGGLAAAIVAMNAKARALGMTQTRFVDPTGLSSRNVSSPADLAKLVIATSRNPHIREYSTDEVHTVRIGRHAVEYRNTNLLVKNAGWAISVQKTGYISEAGQCLVMRTSIDGRNVVIVLLNSQGKYTRVADARRIRKWVEAGGPARTTVAGR
jgi:D-alanyl-D-alanine endopeptidase (penicillin-binding protein 7)